MGGVEVGVRVGVVGGAALRLEIEGGRSSNLDLDASEAKARLECFGGSGRASNGRRGAFQGDVSRSDPGLLSLGVGSFRRKDQRRRERRIVDLEERRRFGDARRGRSHEVFDRQRRDEEGISFFFFITSSSSGIFLTYFFFPSRREESPFVGSKQDAAAQVDAIDVRFVGGAVDDGRRPCRSSPPLESGGFVRGRHGRSFDGDVELFFVEAFDFDAARGGFFGVFDDCDEEVVGMPLRGGGGQERLLVPPLSRDGARS
mmetsp:Transcript_24791/g.80192  ORF Transcript_24791/g.80192 Transcript_24791/m.80192 type:complete len:258 (-) Transcript_24791:556-1329(-)